MILQKRFHANGKLLIAGEYTVIDGGLALAVPTRYGQSLQVDSYSSSHPTLNWEAYLVDQSLWFEAQFDLKNLEILQTSHEKFAQKLQEILRAIEELNPNFFKNSEESFRCKTQLEFPQNWGLGSSSTLIYLLAKWADVDEFSLSDLTFKTSGYDIACAGHDTPILYQNTSQGRMIREIEFNPPFLDQLALVYLNQKQDTQVGVSKHYKSKPKNEELINSITHIVRQILEVQTLVDFENLMEKHEMLLSEHLEIRPVKERLFSDYKGAVKSLGAWGGDFVLITKRSDYKNYFRLNGYSTLLQFTDVI